MEHMVDNIRHYLKVWLLMSKNSLQIVMVSKMLFFVFLLGKILRFGLFLGFLYFLFSGTQSIAGFDRTQIIFFYLSFNLIDILAQFLFREVYRFRPLLISGEFDLILLKPINALLRVLLGGIDLIDLVTLPPLILAIIWVGQSLDPTFFQVITYIILIFNGILIAAAFHIAVISLGVITLELDHTIMIYRDFTRLGTLPVDIYRQPLRAVLTFIVPVGLMITLPAKAIMGLVSPFAVIFGFMLGLVLIFVSIKFWNYALKFYTSASS